MGILEVKAYFQTHQIPEEIREFTVSSATVALAAQALGVAPQRIAKTLAFEMEHSAIIIVAAGDARIDNRKFRNVFHCKAKLLSAEDALRLTGHPVGGVCPFALCTPLDIYLDESLKRFDVVYPAAGNAASCVVITPWRLQQITGATWTDVCKIAEESAT